MKRIFSKGFLGPEGNSLALSFLALHQGKGVGLILGGERNYEGIKTLRCGTMCTTTEFRGTGLAQHLWEMHKTEALARGCKQLFLEVLHAIHRAIRFYDKNGYEKRYVLKYYAGDAIASQHKPYPVQEISFAQLTAFRKRHFGGLHINWQNEMSSIEQYQPVNYGIIQDENLMAAASVHDGVVFFLGVQEPYRCQGLGTALLEHVKKTDANSLRISFPNNASLEGFCRKRGMKLNEVYQYEMYQSI